MLDELESMQIELGATIDEIQALSETSANFASLD